MSQKSTKVVPVDSARVAGHTFTDSDYDAADQAGCRLRGRILSDRAALRAYELAIREIDRHQLPLA